MYYKGAAQNVRVPVQLTRWHEFVVAAHTQPEEYTFMGAFPTEKLAREYSNSIKCYNTLVLLPRDYIFPEGWDA